MSNIPDFRAQLSKFTFDLRVKLMRNALRASAKVVRDEARSEAPTLDGPTRTRKSGTVRDAILVRTSRRDKLAGNVGVFVNVRPQKNKALRGARSRDDPFYWRFIEFGTKFQDARPFLKPAEKKFPAALQVFTKNLSRALLRIEKKGIK